MRPPRVVRRRRVTGSPPHRSVSRRGEGLPGYGAVLFVRAMVEHPAGYGPLLAHTTEKPLLPSGTSGPWASGKVRGFGAACPMAHTFACLRITEAISDAGARLATGRAGSPLAGRDSHPLDDRQHFMEASYPPVPIDPHCLVALIYLSAAYPHQTGCSTCRSSPPEAFDERRHALPRNAVECGGGE